jgi:hypothetical protein
LKVLNLVRHRIWSQTEPHTPLHTVYAYTLYSIFIHTGKGGELNQREGERANRGEYRSQSWVENTNMTECMQEIQSNTGPKVPYRSILIAGDILH